MKTIVLRNLPGLLLGGICAGALFAGPGPQQWQKTEKTRAEYASKPPADVSAEMSQHAVEKCDGCRTTPIWEISDRGPAGKGVPSARITGYAHSCTGCVGKNVSAQGGTTAGMNHAPACATPACCK